MSAWTTADIAPMHGKVAVVTGANSGIGFVAAREMATAGAHVVLACRDIAKGSEAATLIPGSTEVRELDLSDLESVRAFAEATDHTVDVLVNNAGVMAVPERRSVKGYESQFATNYLGHFALTGLLLDRLTDRVVSLSSSVHRVGRIDLDDLNWTHRRYRRWGAYNQSKLATLMFAYELQHRFVAARSLVRSVAAHPGFVSTNLQSHTESVQDSILRLGVRIVGQNAESGALPTLYAATVPDLPGGSFIGPSGFGEIAGPPTQVGSSRASRQRSVQRELWLASERLIDMKITVG